MSIAEIAQVAASHAKAAHCLREIEGKRYPLRGPAYDQMMSLRRKEEYERLAKTFGKDLARLATYGTIY